MPTSDLEVFDHLISDNNTALEIDYLTYAIFAWKKKEWVDHFATQNNATRPTQAQIDAWITQLPASEFDSMRREATEYFEAAADAYLAGRIEEEKKKAVDESILAEIKHHTSPWRHLAIALLMAIVAPFLLGAMFLFYEHSEDLKFNFSKQQSAPVKKAD